MASSRPELGLQLDALVLGSPQPDALVAFYRDQMTMRVAASGDAPDGAWTLLEGAGRRIVIRPSARACLLQASYRADDAAAAERLRARLEKAGVPMRPGVGPWYAQGAGFTFTDPEGHELIVVSGIARADVPGGLPGRLQHVVFSTPGAPALASFYRDVVGFVLSDEVFDDAGTLKSSFIRSDAEHHSLAVFDGAERALDHYCFETPDWAFIRDWADHFSKHGTKLFWGPGRHGPGNNLFFMVLDPDGNRVELSAELEEVPADRPAGKWPFDYRAYNSWGPAPLRV